MYFVIVGLIGMAAGMICAYIVYRLHRIFTRLEDRLDDLTALKERSRQTGATMAGLEDAMAALVSVQYNRNIEQERLDATLRMLQQLRKGPYEYKSEPTGERKEFV